VTLGLQALNVGLYLASHLAEFCAGPLVQNAVG
jgi:hypothetical protein